ncbi:MAG: hypothetical protein H0U86_15880 [Chloroflexi bacterium]|nr:hypothetical protein [Chloroflexota bacterium]
MIGSTIHLRKLAFDVPLMRARKDVGVTIHGGAHRMAMRREPAAIRRRHCPAPRTMGREEHELSADERPIDVSQDLGEETDDRDRGYGFAITDGDIVQLDPDEDEPERD